MGSFLEKHGTKLKYTIIALGFLAMAWVIFSVASGSGADPGRASRHRTMIDSVTLEVFEDYGIREGETIPYKNPKTGERTLYPAEKCYWTRDGKAKLEPTYVLLNETIGKPGPTICPDCGRRVVGHNPMPPLELLQEAENAAGGGP